MAVWSFRHLSHTSICDEAGQKKAREMWFLARLYSAQEALDMGLVNTVVPLAELEAETVSWCVSEPFDRCFLIRARPDRHFHPLSVDVGYHTHIRLRCIARLIEMVVRGMALKDTFPGYLASNQSRVRWQQACQHALQCRTSNFALIRHETWSPLAKQGEFPSVA